MNLVMGTDPAAARSGLNWQKKTHCTRVQWVDNSQIGFGPYRDASEELHHCHHQSHAVGTAPCTAKSDIPYGMDTVVIGTDENFRVSMKMIIGSLRSKGNVVNQ